MTFTIFTGCYNSAQFLPRVFKSLLSQSLKDFEWIVVDDASKDNTVQLLEDFQKDHPELDITIIRRESNRGVAANRRKAISLARGQYFVTWDHDDEQVPDQLKVFKETWEEFGDENIANIFAFCKDQQGNILGRQFPQGSHVANYFTHYKDYMMSHKEVTEKHACTRIDVLKDNFEHKFKEGQITDGEMLWAKLALDYDFVFINDPLRIYYLEAENQDNMSKRTRSQMAEGVYFNKKIWVNHYLNRLKNEPLLQLRIIFAMVFYGQLSGRSPGVILGEIDSKLKSFLGFILVVPASLLIKKMKWSGKGL